MQNNSKKRDTDSKILPLLVTTGEPAGIGMDIILILASQGKLAELDRQVVVVANNNTLEQRCDQLFKLYDIRTSKENSKEAERHDNLLEKKVIEAEFSQNTYGHKIPNWEVMYSLKTPAHIDDVNSLALMQNFHSKLSEYDSATSTPDFIVIDIESSDSVVPGNLNVKNASMVFKQLQLAHDMALNRLVAAIVTGPIQKSILIDAGLTLNDGSMFTGHTEFFMQQCQCEKVVMMLANTAMKVALVTTHLPLSKVAGAITKNNVRSTINIVLNELNTKFGIATPKILVCGLNPHAGEGGHLGMEEIEIINPVLKDFQNNGVLISDAMPADTLFTKHYLKDCDAVIAMFHDQGLPVLKSHGFGDTVNLTLGLPYIRTSVDHGTALDLAGDNISNTKVSASSLWQALSMANKMANNSSDLMSSQSDK